MRWENLPNTTTPLNKINLEKIEEIHYIPTNIDSTTGWYLALSGNIGGYDNNAFILSIQQIDSGSSGQLYANIRCNNSNSLELIEFKWLSNTGLNSSDFKLKLDGNNYYLYVNASLAYTQYQIKVTQQSSLRENKENVLTFYSPTASETVQEPNGITPDNRDEFGLLHLRYNNTQYSFSVDKLDGGYCTYVIYGGWENHFMHLLTISPYEQRVVGYSQIFNNTTNEANITGVTISNNIVTINFNSTIWGGIHIIGEKVQKV